MSDINKSKKGFEISIWGIIVICFTIVLVVAMLTGNLDKLIEYLKTDTVSDVQRMVHWAEIEKIPKAVVVSLSWKKRIQ